jgi:hypothetical protein
LVSVNFSRRALLMLTLQLSDAKAIFIAFIGITTIVYAAVKISACRYGYMDEQSTRWVSRAVISLALELERRRDGLACRTQELRPRAGSRTLA